MTDLRAELMQQGVDAFRRGDLTAADAVFARLIAALPDQVDGWVNRSATLLLLGSFESALQHADRALEIDDRHMTALNNRGTALMRLDRPRDAVAAFDRLLKLDPQRPRALIERGNAYRRLGLPREALASYREAMKQSPLDTAAMINCGGALLDLNEPEQALGQFQAAAAIAPADPIALTGQGAAYALLHQYELAVDCHKRAVTLDQNNKEAINNLGSAFLALGQTDAALNAFDKALKISPNWAVALSNSGNALLRAKRYGDAANAFQTLANIDAAHEFGLGNLLLSRLHHCDWTDYDRLTKRIASLIETGAAVVKPLTAALAFDDPALLRRCTELYVGTQHQQSHAPDATVATAASDRIRIAYLSCDFHDHAVGRLVANLLAQHDTSRFEISCVDLAPAGAGDIRHRIIAASDRFVNAERKSDCEVAAMLREWRIDISVDLTGHTLRGRPGIARLRGAPIQAAYLGFPGTMGMPAYDYILADETVIPREFEAHYTERVARLWATYFPCPDFGATPTAFKDRPSVGLPDHGFVFCCFNNNNKISPAIFDSWMSVLAGVPGSVLWLRQDSEHTVRNLLREAQARNVDPHRLIFAPRVSLADHAGRLQFADIFLDTAPYNAHSTAADFLLAGVPVITLIGRSFAGRVAASLLAATGLPDLVARSRDEYVQLALSLANDPDRLALARDMLKTAAATAPLFDRHRATQSLEAAYDEMIARFRRGEPPASFSVPPIKPARVQSGSDDRPRRERHR